MGSTPLDRLLRRVTPDAVARSYLAKFALAVCLVVVAIGAVGAVTYAETTDHLESNAQDDYTAVAELSATELDLWVSDQRAVARDVADYDVFTRDSNTIAGYLTSHLTRTADEVVAFHFVDRDEGTVVASTSSDDRGETVTSQPWFDGTLLFGERVYTSPTYAVGDDRRVAFVAGTPMRDYLVMEVALDPVVADLRQPTAGSFTTIVQDDGTIGASDRDAVAGERYDGGIRAALFDEDDPVGHVASATFDFTDGAEYFVAYAPVPSEDWHVAIHVPLSEAYALSGMIGRNLLLIVGVAVVGLGLLGATLGRGTVVELRRLSGKAEALESGDLDIGFETDRIDEFGGLYGSFDGMRDSLREQIESAETQRERAEAAKTESEAFATALSERAAAFGETMSECADGDLTARLETEPDDPEALESIADGFNEAMSELERTVAEVETFAAEVADESESVTEDAAEVAQAGEETSEAVDEISAGAERQSRQLSEVAGEMEDMSATIEEVAASADEVAATSRRADTLATEGQAATAAAVEELHAVEERSASAAETVERLEAEMEAVDEIVETISEIADQTNLLALNASIEAARAGEAGSGFAVVAEEVKSLAEETQTSAAEVESLIATLGERTDESVAEMAAIREGVDDGVDTVETAEGRLETIADRVAEADEGVQEISDAMDAQASSVNEVTGAVDDLAGISQQTTAEATTVASAAEEQAATLDTVSTRAGELTEHARTLRATVDTFETDVDATFGANTVRSPEESDNDPAADAETEATGFAFDEPASDPSVSADGGVADSDTKRDRN